MSTGKLYKSNRELIASVNYRLFNESKADWTGELVLTKYQRLDDGDGYILELEDGRLGKCSLKKRINCAVSSLPPLFRYHYKGHQLDD